jgi:lipooligosaccharide transport system permease protein
MTATPYVLEYHLVNYRRTWRSSALSSFVLPLLTMLGFGVGVGAYVTGGVDGVPYLDWMVPGLIASTAMQTAMGESSWPVLSYFAWLRSYFAQAAAPLKVSDILDGHLGFVVFRVLTSCTAFLLIAAAFGTMHSWWALATPPIAALVGLAVAAPTFAYASSIQSDSYLAILFRLGMIPMSLFSGVFFPVESLPVLLRWVAYVLPLWHGVDLCRAATLGVAPQWSATSHVLYLAAWAVVGWLFAYRQFRRRLVV